MLVSETFRFPAFIQKTKGLFGVYFPTLFPEYGWEFPLSKGRTKNEAIKHAEKQLAYSLAGILYDNEEIPVPIPINRNKLSKGMELIEVVTSLSLYEKQIKEHLKGRHWHISYYVEGTNNSIEAIGFKNEQGMWDIYYIEDSINANLDEYRLLFTVKLYEEAEELFHRFVESEVIKRN